MQSIDISDLRSEIQHVYPSLLLLVLPCDHHWLIPVSCQAAAVSPASTTSETRSSSVMHHTEKEVKSNLALYFNSRALALQLHCTQMSVTRLFSHLKPCKGETNHEDHARWRFNQNQIGKGKLLRLDQSLSWCKSRLLCCLWQGCVSFPQPRI